MKNWINRLFSGSDENSAAKDAAALRGGATGAGSHAADVRVEIDSRFYRWLAGSAWYNAPEETENLILDEIAKLANAPDDAAGLVPRLPEVIPQLLRSLNDESVQTAELSRQVTQDVVLTAELLREANSAYYRPIEPVNNIEAAIAMLGQNGLRMLLARLAFRPIIQMQENGFARRAASHVWSQSEMCALASSLVAPGLTADVFESYLAGLMQNVGLIVAFRVSDSVGQNGKVPHSDEFAVRLLAASRNLSAAIATYWDFPEEVAEAIAQADSPGESKLAQALSKGDRIAKLRLLIDSCALEPDDPLVTNGLDAFQRRCLGKLSTLDG